MALPVHKLAFLLLVGSSFLPNIFHLQMLSAQEVVATQIAPLIDPEASPIIERHLQALGGKEAWMALKTVQCKGKLREGHTIYNIVRFLSAPDAYREERQWEHMGWKNAVLVASTEGTGWQQEMAPNRKAPEWIDSERNLSLQWKTLLHTPLISAESRGYPVRYLGIRTTGDRSCHALRVILAENYSVDYYIDAATGLILRLKFPDRFGTTWTQVDAWILRYKKIEGLYFPTEIEYRVDGKTYKTESLYDFEFNRPIPESWFRFPGQKPE
jgi:hypothetical protein